MLPTVEGVFRDGKIELNETPAGLNRARVIVTFLPADGPIDLASAGMTREQAAELRDRLRTFAEDWDRPDMDVYNDM